MPATCLSADRLQSFLGGGLSPLDVEQVADHVQTCRQCELELAILSDDSGTRTIARRECPSFQDDSELLDDLMRRVEAATLLQQACAKETPKSRDDEDESREFLRLGQYRIIRELGRGTFGIVYLAEDERLWRNVALKVARAGVMADPQLRERFFREAAALARVAHPHIVPVYEVSEAEGKCYLVVGYCDGPTLDEWLHMQSQPAPPRMAAQILIPLAEAAEYAHCQGILHRDIKPGNILLHPLAEQNEGGLPFVPQLTDFGMAKFVEEKSQATLAGVVLGTPQYMAPEQAAGHTQRIGPPTDVYALGAVLYELLAGRPPIEGKTAIDTLRRVLIDDPPEVCAVAEEVPGDLGAIVMKCLEKSPSQRYRSARELADDLRNYLSGRPTIARPLSAVQRMARCIRRNPLPAALLTLATLAAALGIGLWDFSRELSVTRAAAARESERASSLARHVESTASSIAQRDYVHDIRAAAHEALRGNTTDAVATLRRQLHSTYETNLRSFEWDYLWARTTRKPLAETNAGVEVYQICLSPDEKQLIAAGKDGRLRFFQARSLNLIETVSAEQGEVNGVAFSPDGERLATVGNDGTVRLWDARSRRPTQTIAAHPGRAYGVVFFEGGQKLATCGKDELIRLWNTATGEASGTLVGHTKSVDALAISPDGKLLGSAASDRTAILWDLHEQRQVHVLKGHSHRLSSVCFSPDGRRLATAAHDRTVALWDVASGRELGEQHFLDAVLTVGFSPKGNRLFIGDRRGAVRVCGIVTSEADHPRLELVLESPDDAWAAQSGRLWSLATARNRILFTAGEDGQIRRWHSERAEPLERVIPAVRGDRFFDFEFTEDGQSFLALRENLGIEVLDMQSLQARRLLTARATEWRTLTLLTGRDEVAAGTASGDVAIWNWKSGALLRTLLPQHGDYAVAQLAFSASLGLIAVLPLELDDVRLYAAASGRYLGSLPSHNHSALAISPDGRRLAVDAAAEIWIYDLETRQRVQVLAGHSGSIYALAFSHDGEMLASGGSDRSVRLWSRAGGLLSVLQEHHAALSHLEFTPDGKTLLSADRIGVLKANHVATARALFDVPLQTGRIGALTISPAGSHVAALRDASDILVIHSAP